VRRCAHDPAAFEPCPQAAHHGLDLGEFRHGRGAGYTCVP
jgi:hypothetical protein